MTPRNLKQLMRMPGNFAPWRLGVKFDAAAPAKIALVAGAGGVTVAPAMKILPGNGKISGFSLIELLVVIWVIAVLVAMLLPTSTGPRKARMAVCLNNQKQIAIGLIMFNDDHAGNYPWQVTATNGGSMESVSSNQAFPHFRALSGYFGNRKTIFVCPTDDSRYAATNHSQIIDKNISYFLNLDATRNSRVIFGGDRHLEANNKAVNSGLFVYSTNLVLNWTRELHGKVQNGPIGGLGGLAFADGHVQFTRIKDLNSFFRNQPFVTNHIIVP